MPTDSHFLFEEGAKIISFKLVKAGKFQEDGATKLLLHDPAQYPHCTGTRNLQDNVSDLKAQVASNMRGITLVKDLIDEYGKDVVVAYMKHIRDNAEDNVRIYLKAMSKSRGTVLSADDYLDDGSRINLTITIDSENGSAVFDFDGTSPQVYGNLNAPKSVTFSA